MDILQIISVRQQRGFAECNHQFALSDIGGGGGEGVDHFAVTGHRVPTSGGWRILFIYDGQELPLPRETCLIFNIKTIQIHGIKKSDIIRESFDNLLVPRD